jgi:lipopolysaccharide export system permease protein
MISPFFVGFSVITFLFVMDLLLDYLELILEKGVPVATVLQLFLLGLGWMVALSVPCGVLVGTLMTFGRMSQDNEILAMRSSGISQVTILRPVLMWGAFWTLGMLLFNNYVLPWSNYQFAQLVAEINRTRPTAELDEGVFIDAFEGHRILFDRLDPRSGTIEGIKILDFRKGERLKTTTARRGRLRYDAAHDLLVMELQDGELNEVPDDAPDPRDFRRTVFQEHVVSVRGAAEAVHEQTRRRGSREMSAAELRGEYRAQEDRRDLVLTKQDTLVTAQGYSSLAELGAYVEPPRPWYDRLLDPVRPAPLLGRPKTRRPFVGPPDLTAVENYKMARLQAESFDKRASQFRVEYHKKFSIAFACAVFVLLGAPLGMLARRGGVRAGFLSVVFFLFYYLCLVGGEQLADRRLLRPWLSMWFPNIILGLLTIVFVARIADVHWRWRRSS